LEFNLGYFLPLLFRLSPSPGQIGFIPPKGLSVSLRLSSTFSQLFFAAGSGKSHQIPCSELFLYNLSGTFCVTLRFVSFFLKFEKVRPFSKDHALICETFWCDHVVPSLILKLENQRYQFPEFLPERFVPF